MSKAAAPKKASAKASAKAAPKVAKAPKKAAAKSEAKKAPAKAKAKAKAKKGKGKSTLPENTVPAGVKVTARKDPAAEAGVDLSRRQADLESANSDENSSEGIADQVEAFLSQGKKIKEIPVGVSGITHTGGTKHITISRNKN